MCYYGGMLGDYMPLRYYTFFNFWGFFGGYMTSRRPTASSSGFNNQYCMYVRKTKFQVSLPATQCMVLLMAMAQNDAPMLQRKNRKRLDNALERLVEKGLLLRHESVRVASGVFYGRTPIYTVTREGIKLGELIELAGYSETGEQWLEAA